MLLYTSKLIIEHVVLKISFLYWLLKDRIKSRHSVNFISLVCPCFKSMKYKADT